MFKKWCNESYCDGIRELYQSRNQPVGFTFWILAMIIMVSGTGIFIAKVINTYKKSPIRTTYTNIPVSEMVMPEILLCFNGGLNGSAMMNANISKGLILALSGAMTLGTMDLNLVESSYAELDDYLHSNEMDILQFYQKFSYHCEDMVELVYPPGVGRTFHNFACGNLSQILSPFYGLCLLYRDNGIQHEPGTNGGMRIYLKSPPDSVSALFPDLALKADRSLGFVVFVEKEFFIHTEKQYLVPINMKVEISLLANHFLRLPESLKKCNPKEKFSSTNCFNRCFGDVFYNSCGCYPFRYYNPQVDKFKKICNIFEEQLCTTFNSKATQECEGNCIPICDEWLYDVVVSYASSGSTNTSSLWIGYSSMQYTKIADEYAFSIEDAIANIGYQAGLWLGISIVSIIQGVYYICLALLSLHRE